MKDSPDRKLLVLDLDETLVHAAETPLPHPPEMRVGPYHVYRRPHLDTFVDAVLAEFTVAVWTSSSADYAAQIVRSIFPPDALAFVWSAARCTLVYDPETGEYATRKDLRKLTRRGYPRESVVVVDDTPSKWARSYGNLVAVRPFLGDPDDELPRLARYLKTLAAVPNVRAVEKRGWRGS